MPSESAPAVRPHAIVGRPGMVELARAPPGGKLWVYHYHPLKPGVMILSFRNGSDRLAHRAGTAQRFRGGERLDKPHRFRSSAASAGEIVAMRDLLLRAGLALLISLSSLGLAQNSSAT